MDVVGSVSWSEIGGMGLYALSWLAVGCVVVRFGADRWRR